MNKSIVFGASTWLIWLGVTGTLIVVASMAAFDAGTVLGGAVPPDHVDSHQSMQGWLRIAFLLISVGAIWRLRLRLSTQWRWAVGAALTVLALAVAGELAGSLGRPGWIMDIGAGLGTVDSLEWRIFRLGAMAAYAVPMLALLAAGERKQETVSESRRMTVRIAALLVRWEALLFAVGASTLASLLMAAAFIHNDFAWLSAVGADASVAACAAAAIRARRRADRLVFGAWLLICGGMAIGLFMGIYSFGGPLPAPSVIGDYNALPRVLLRDGHVILLAIGIAGIAVAAVRQPHEGVP